MPWPTNPERDEPLSVPLDTETVLRAMLSAERDCDDQPDAEADADAEV